MNGSSILPNWRLWRDAGHPQLSSRATLRSLPPVLGISEAPLQHPRPKHPPFRSTGARTQRTIATLDAPEQAQWEEVEFEVVVEEEDRECSDSPPQPRILQTILVQLSATAS